MVQIPLYLFGAIRPSLGVGKDEFFSNLLEG
jgi:hypothetical protein